MTDTELISAPETSRRRAGLSGMVLTELRSLAGELGIKSISGMRKGDLIAAISERQSGAASAKSAKSDAPKSDAPKTRRSAASTPAVEDRPAAEAAPASEVSTADASATQSVDAADSAPETGRRARGRRAAGRRAGAPDQLPLDDSDNSAGSETAPTTSSADTASSEKQDEGDNAAPERPRRSRGERNRQDGSDREQRDADGNRDNGARDNGSRNQGDRDTATRENGNRDNGNRNQNDRNQNDRNQGDRDNSNRDNGGRNQSDRNGRNRNQGDGRNDNRNEERNNGPRDNRDNNQDDEGEGRGRRGRRFRERRRGRDRGEGNDGGGGRERDTEIREDDVLQPVAGILDVLDNYAFVRTSGYLAGPNDVYVSMNLVRKNGLRRGDAVTGAVRVAREGEQSSQRQKFNPLVRLDTVNGGEVEAARKRPEFGKLTPLYPNQRLRLETQQNILTTRIIDLVMPIGKGQRALIVSPPKAGKTSVLQAIANAIAINNPECYLMVILVDERPEEVTDMQRSVKGEVIASTFDRPPGDHTAVAELAIERAKRLVEAGQDVVVLLDSITRLGRAYNNSSPASGRILSGGVDSTALYPPKRFLGAARNIEHGGSLTIIATAMVETGSTGDTVIFEEFKGTGNAELKLDRKIAERRVFPAVDINPSSTRHDELLLAPDEAAVVHKLRRVLSGLDSHQAIDLLVDRLKKSKNNLEFLMEVSKTAPGGNND
ncbi:transcription termination factor Rho [Rhodococcus sp. 06-412-2C]|uniref:transcription termination factor Rho n=1 Tax=unclassified Rhodococcus (in: high G+C Gram-positive bacteria) TaxID=192944 RepID=UPI000B9B0ED9|nr:MULTISPECIES: transcription termination factor Rho [unclassified Rhodococcus (in: high G+C Gram-positive bacteria)]OZC93579.1 transcription termination factor Rho [Rhodococcus sp. 06-412-2C]OZD03755.1 transcription termination factor Rho [Rhodococcus sp. 06-412-2B]